MSDILENEAIETTETTEEVTESIEVPIDEPIETEPTEETPVEPIIPQRVNPFCVISKETFGEYAVRDIQTNSSWGENPYGDTYAVVPDEMVPDIMETRGFCDIMLSEDGTEVVNFTAREIPDIPTPEPEPTEEQKRIAELETKLEETEVYQLEQDNMILENNFEILVLQEGIQDIV